MAKSIHNSMTKTKEIYDKDVAVELKSEGDPHGTARARRNYRNSNPNTDERKRHPDNYEGRDGVWPRKRTIKCYTTAKKAESILHTNLFS